MASSSVPVIATKEEVINFCPICGVSVSTTDTEIHPNICRACGFKLNLVYKSKTIESKPIIPANIPAFAKIALLIQGVASFLLGLLFFFFGSPLYMIFSQIIVILQVITIVILSIFYILLQLSVSVSSVRIALLVFGMFTVPFGIFAIAAALSISPTRRHCVVCRKRISWTKSFSDCPNCQSSFHRWGSCRLSHKHLLTKKWGREPSKFEIDHTCPYCFQNIKETTVGGKQID